uniref:Transposase n=1 Tax=Mesocestoides corti TaxID=53468 RepID=A0A5K3FBZ8_MESCO
MEPYTTVEHVVTTVTEDSLKKGIQNSQKKGVNKFIRQIRRMGWVKKLHSPKSDSNRQLENSVIAVVNPNARCEFDDTFDEFRRMFISECGSGCRPLCLPINITESSDISAPLRLTSGCQLTSAFRRFVLLIVCTHE